MAVYKRYAKKRRDLQNMILPKRYPILYTNRNYMVAPKVNKGIVTTSQLRKAHLHRSKALLFSHSK